MAKEWVAIGIGSNINRSANIRAGVRFLAQQFLPDIEQLRVSPVYESAALGFTGPPFYNLVVSFYSAAPLLDIQRACKALEQQFGRDEHATKCSSRRLDLDILLYGQRVQAAAEGEPELPRAEVLTSAFVLKPLADLHPLFKHPQRGENYLSLWQQFLHSPAGQLQPLTPIAFTW